MKAFSSVELKRFGLRFAICLLLVGGLYLLIFVFTPRWLKHTPPSQQIATLRANLDQIYINQNSIISFSGDDSATYNSLNGLIQQHGSAVSNLKKSYSQAEKQLNKKQQDTLKSIISRQQQANSNLKSSYNSLSSLLQYDPANDLGGLRPKTDQAKIVARVNAANNGLKDLSGANFSSNLNNDTGLIINCLEGLKNSPKDIRVDKFTTKVNSCEQRYTKLRRAAVAYIANQGFPQGLRDYIIQEVPKLLKQFS